MLSRLIRHEWKETWRIPVISFLIILILTLVCFFLFRQMEPPWQHEAAVLFFPLLQADLENDER